MGTVRATAHLVAEPRVVRVRYVGAARDSAPAHVRTHMLWEVRQHRGSAARHERAGGRERPCLGGARRCPFSRPLDSHRTPGEPEATKGGLRHLSLVPGTLPAAAQRVHMNSLWY